MPLAFQDAKNRVLKAIPGNTCQGFFSKCGRHILFIFSEIMRIFVVVYNDYI